MFKRAYGIAAAGTALATVTGPAAFTTGAPPASATTAHISAHQARVAPDLSSPCPHGTHTQKSASTAKTASTPMRQGPGPIGQESNGMH